jgi:hypothetical protein
MRQVPQISCSAAGNDLSTHAPYQIINQHHYPRPSGIWLSKKRHHC